MDTVHSFFAKEFHCRITKRMSYAIHEYQWTAWLMAWFGINLMLAVSTELYSDEAYYWLFSRFLDWGYFDHPPMVAVLIKLGTLVFPNEAGLRIPFILMLTMMVALIYHMCKPVSPLLFFITIFSIFSLNIMGFIGGPDTPFIFFGVLFFLLYRQFLKRPSYVHALYLGLISAALMYSKYHGILILGFTILSNPRLLTRRTFYFSLFVGLLLFSPHIWWQLQHDFPSIKYHLVDRSTSYYQFKQTWGYLLGNLPFHGPWVSLTLAVAGVVYKPKDSWELALKWNLAGFYVFFLIMTTTKFIEPNWTIFMIVPMVILGLKQIQQWERFRPLYLKGCYVSALILLIFKLHIVYPMTVIKGDRVWEFHGREQFAKNVFKSSVGLAVAANRYQEASILSYYSPDQSVLVPAINIGSRSNQFDLWNLDTVLCGKKVLYVNNHLPGHQIQWQKSLEKRMTFVHNFLPVSNFRLEIEHETASHMVANLIFTNSTCATEDFHNIFLSVDYGRQGEKVQLGLIEISKVIRSDHQQVTFPVTLTLKDHLKAADLIFSLYFKELGGTIRLRPTSCN